MALDTWQGGTKTGNQHLATLSCPMKRSVGPIHLYIIFNKISSYSKISCPKIRWVYTWQGGTKTGNRHIATQEEIVISSFNIIILVGTILIENDSDKTWCFLFTWSFSHCRCQPNDRKMFLWTVNISPSLKIWTTRPSNIVGQGYSQCGYILRCSHFSMLLWPLGYN